MPSPAPETCFAPSPMTEALPPDVLANPLLRQEDVLKIVAKYADGGASPDPYVIILAKAYMRLLYICHRTREHSIDASAHLSALAKSLDEVAGVY